MSHEAAVKFLSSLEGAAKTGDPAALVAAGVAAGHSFTEDEVRAALAQTADELSEDALAKVAGGVDEGDEAVIAGDGTEDCPDDSMGYDPNDPTQDPNYDPSQDPNYDPSQGGGQDPNWDPNDPTQPPPS